MSLSGTENKVCVICYCNDAYTLKCADKYCTTRICGDCFVAYLNHCLSEKSLVKCLDQHCKSYIISDSFEKNNNYHTLYKKVLLAAFISSQGPEVSNQINISKMIENLRTQRKQYVKTFPKAVELVIDIALYKKYNNIGKQNKLYIKEVVTRSNRLCMNSHCNGKLNDEFECMKCSTLFCKDCEKIKKADHVCNISDLDSLKLMSSFKKCPKCNIVIERNEGCFNMTCGSCQTSFDYKTGELSEHGSHNYIIGLQKTKFNFDFKQAYSDEIGRRLFYIESNEPKEPCILALNNIIKKLLLQSENPDGLITVGDDVLKTFEKYLKSKISYINYINVTIEVNELHQSDNMTMFDLDRIIAKNGWDNFY